MLATQWCLHRREGLRVPRRVRDVLGIDVYLVEENCEVSRDPASNVVFGGRKRSTRSVGVRL